MTNNPLKYTDSLGLVKWTGSQTSIGAGTGVGAVRFKFKLTSECINGKRGYAEVIAGGPAVGAGVDYSATWSKVEFEDDSSMVNTFVFSGSARFVAASWAAGFMGYSWQAIQLGNALSIGGGSQTGWDASIFGGAGISTVTDSKIEDCDCNVK